jgi:hypothetical protein
VGRRRRVRPGDPPQIDASQCRKHPLRGQFFLHSQRVHLDQVVLHPRPAEDADAPGCGPWACPHPDESAATDIPATAVGHAGEAETGPMSDPTCPAPRIGSLCTGYGRLDLAVELVLGGRLRWYAETDPHASTVLARHWPGIPNLGDLRAVDWTGVEPVDIIAAGFPCQD